MSNAVSRPMSCLPAKLKSISSEGPLCEAAVDAVIALAMAAANIATVIRFRTLMPRLARCAAVLMLMGMIKKRLI